MSLVFKINYFNNESEFSDFKQSENCEFHIKDITGGVFCSGSISGEIFNDDFDKKIVSLFKTFKDKGCKRENIQAFFILKDTLSDYQSHIKKFLDCTIYL